jgi:Ca2+-binding EF-hand superfamily protein
MLTQLQSQKLRHFFNILDYNKNHVLQRQDFDRVGINICQTLGISEGTEDFDKIIQRSRRLFVQLIKDLDKDDQANISLEEWLKLFDQIIGQKDMEKLKYYIKLTTIYIFELFDLDKNGIISLDEYVDMFTIYHIDVKYSAKSFLNLDTNHDDCISKVELFNAVTDFFISDDPDAAGNWIFGNWEG